MARQGRRKQFFKGGGGRFKCLLSIRLFCTDLSPDLLYRKCIKFTTKKVGGGGESSDPPFPMPLMARAIIQEHMFRVSPPKQYLSLTRGRM